MSGHFAANKWGLRFHHLGLAVKDVDAAVEFLSGLGYRAGPTVFDPLQNVNLGMFTHEAMPDVEIIHPADGAGPLDELLASHREGLVYHACYTSADLDASLEAMETDTNLRLFEVSPPKPAVLFGGKPVSFYVVGGVGLIEIIDEKPAPAA
jgi:catechol 2,3-dioxygenase-like lactoylglutathione lyase family enzyme